MELKEAIEAGIWREKVSAVFYKELAKKVHGDLKLLLEYMSMEEVEHEKFLRRLYFELFQTNPQEIPSEGKIEIRDFEIKSIDELLDVGISKERESKFFYMELFCRLENMQDRERILDLINFEESHLQKLLKAKQEV